MLDAQAHGIASAIVGDSPIMALLDVSIAQLNRGQVLTSRQARDERRKTFRHFLLIRRRLISARIRQLLGENYKWLKS